MSVPANAGGQAFAQVGANQNGPFDATDPNSRKPGGKSLDPDFNSLTDLIVSTISPDTWDSVGGPASVRAHETTLSLVIRQTQKIHEEIADLLDQLRRLQDLQVTIEVRFVTVSTGSSNESVSTSTSTCPSTGRAAGGQQRHPTAAVRVGQPAAVRPSGGQPGISSNRVNRDSRPATTGTAATGRAAAGLVWCGPERCNSLPQSAALPSSVWATDYLLAELRRSLPAGFVRSGRADVRRLQPAGRRAGRFRHPQRYRGVLLHPGGSGRSTQQPDVRPEGDAVQRPDRNGDFRCEHQVVSLISLSGLDEEERLNVTQDGHTHFQTGLRVVAADVGTPTWNEPCWNGTGEILE